MSQSVRDREIAFVL